MKNIGIFWSENFPVLVMNEVSHDNAGVYLKIVNIKNAKLNLCFTIAQLTVK